MKFEALSQIRRRTLIASAGALVLPAIGWTAQYPLVEVWKDANCGCCKDWVVYLEKSGFAVKVNETGNNGARARFGMPAKFGSCHTGLIEGYAIEGHVPESEIKRLLKEKPNAIGLAVSGMPVGSPGMDGEIYKGRKDSFYVLLVFRDGRSLVYQSYS